MLRPTPRFLACFTLLLPALAACDEGNRACTTVFAAVTVYLQDQAQAPVADATLTTVLVRTGDTLTATGLAMFGSGHYVVVDDGALPKLGSTADSLAVTVQRGPASFMIGYRVRDDGCHVEVVAGPDTVTVP